MIQVTEKWFCTLKDYVYLHGASLLSNGIFKCVCVYVCVCVCVCVCLRVYGCGFMGVGVLGEVLLLKDYIYLC